MRGSVTRTVNDEKIAFALSKVFVREIKRKRYADTWVAENAGITRYELQKLLYGRGYVDIGILYRISLSIGFPLSQAFRQAEVVIKKERTNKHKAINYKDKKTMEEAGLYSVGDNVWYMDEGKAKSGKVIDASQDPSDSTWTYDVEDSQDGGVADFDEYELFATPETLVRDVFEDYDLGEDLDLDML